jgi:Retrotransposon gag protein
MAGQAPQTPTPLLQAAPAAPHYLTGKLRGTELDIFYSDRSKSEVFKQQFTTFQKLNDRHEVMEIPYYHTMQALSLMKGPMVNDWAADQVQILRDRVNHPTNPVGQDQEVHWIEFERAFDTAFTDTTKQQNAHNTLRQLCMQGNDLDNYVTAFKKLARDTGYTLDTQGTIFIFATSLKLGLQKAILH